MASSSRACSSAFLPPVPRLRSSRCFFSRSTFMVAIDSAVGAGAWSPSSKAVPPLSALAAAAAAASAAASAMTAWPSADTGQ
eukprot:scaffold8504_cov83-Phaeocystis_antarctica.AAC.2